MEWELTRSIASWGYSLLSSAGMSKLSLSVPNLEVQVFLALNLCFQLYSGVWVYVSVFLTPGMVSTFFLRMFPYSRISSTPMLAIML